MKQLVSRVGYVEVKMFEHQEAACTGSQNQTVQKDSGVWLSLAEVLMMLKQMSSNLTQQLQQQKQ